MPLWVLMHKNNQERSGLCFQDYKFMGNMKDSFEKPAPVACVNGTGNDWFEVETLVVKVPTPPTPPPLPFKSVTVVK